MEKIGGRHRKEKTKGRDMEKIRERGETRKRLGEDMKKKRERGGDMKRSLSTKISSVSHVCEYSLEKSKELMRVRYKHQAYFILWEVR